VCGIEAHAGRAILDPDDAPVGLRGFPGLVVHVLERTIGPVDDQRQVDGAGLLRHLAPDAGVVGLLHVAAFELQAEMALGRGGEREDHDAGGVHVETMDKQRLGEGRLNAGQQAIGEVIALAWHRQEARGLVHEQDLVVGVDHRSGVSGGR
jgi:hypothetical protein